LKTIIISILIRSTLVSYTIPVSDNGAGFFANLFNFVIYLLLCITIQLIPITFQFWNINTKQTNHFYKLIKNYFSFGIPIHITVGFLFPYIEPIIFSFLPDLAILLLFYLRKKSIKLI